MKPIFMLAAAAVSASLLLPTVSNAATAADLAVATEQVRYDDLNLTTSAGRADLERRIAASARRVCGDNGVIVLHERLAFRECVKQAKQQGDQQVQLALAAQVNRRRA